MSKELEISLIKLPDNLSASNIYKYIERIKLIDEEVLLLLYNAFKNASLPSLEDEDLCESISEEDLFKLDSHGQELLKQKFVIKQYIKESIENVLMPFLMGDSHSKCGNILYMKIESSYYAISGGESYTYSFSNRGSAYIKLLSATKILEKNT